MIDEYCECGIKYQHLKVGVIHCPRCQITKHIVFEERDMTTYTPPKGLTGIVASKATTSEHEVVIDKVLEPLIDKATGCLDASKVKFLIPCDVCGTEMRAGCNETCSNCGWISPCSTGS